MIKNFVTYLNDNFEDTIFNKAKYFLYDNKFKLNIRTNYIENPKSFVLDSVTVTSITKYKKLNDITYINFNVRLGALIRGHNGSRKYSDVNEDLAYTYLNMSAKFSFNNGIQNFYISNTIPIDEKESFKNIDCVNNSLIPYISSSSLDEYAEKFINYYYPRALVEPLAFPIKKVANAMHLTIVKKPLPENVYAKFYFIDDIENNINKNTIVIDECKTSFEGMLCINNSIAHECVHKYLHEDYFNLQRLLYQGLTNIQCEEIKENNIFISNISDYKWMEWQANAIAPRILVPTKTLKIQYKKMYITYKDKYINEPIKLYKEILNNLSSFFEVTPELMKVRLLQSGYNEFQGISLYDDISYISHNEFNKNISYKISLNSLFFNSLTNKNLYDALVSRRLLYIDGFVILNSEECLEYNNKNISIKSHVFNHIEEYCLSFVEQKKSINEYNYYYSLVFLCKGKKKNVHLESSFDLCDCKENTNLLSKSYKDMMLDFSDAKELLQECYMVDQNFTDVYNTIYDYLEVPSDYYLSQRTNISETSLSKYRNGTIPSKKNIIAICIGLNLHPLVSEYLLKLVSIDLAHSLNMVDRLYYLILQTLYNSDIAEINKVLKDAGLNEECLF